MQTSDNARLQLLEDLFAIQALEYRYAHAVDRRDLDLLEQVFASDARFIYQDFGELAGLAQFKEMVRANWPVLDSTHHMIFSPSITIDRDTARCCCYAQAQHIRHELAPDFMLLMGGNYEDTLCRRDGRWLITNRRMSNAWGIGNPAVLGWGPEAANIFRAQAILGPGPAGI